MNELFEQAQTFHAVINDRKKNLEFDSDTLGFIVFATRLYSNVVMSALRAGDAENITDMYMELHKRSMLPNELTWQICMILDALAYTKREATELDVTNALALYYTYRRGILTVLEKLSPPYYKDGFVYHDVLGVKAPSKEYSWKLDLECLYTDWVVSA